jgi:hypothetical protein
LILKGEVMKTARSIEEQSERKALEQGQVEKGQVKGKKAEKGALPSQNSFPVSSKRSRHGDASQLKPYWFKPGQSGNPGGRPKVDLSAEIARALFEQDAAAIFTAFRKVLRKGSPYAFQVLSDRAFGKLKERVELDSSAFAGVSDEDLIKRVRELEQKLGYAPCELPSLPSPQILPPADDKDKPN